MENYLKIDNPLAFRLLFTESLYNIVEKKEVLVSPPVVQLVSEPKEELQGQFTYLGENNKYILFVTFDAQELVLNKLDLTLLEKILGAKKWEFRDVAILNIARYPQVTLDELKTFFACSKLIGLGIKPSVLRMENDTLNTIFEHKDVKMFFSYALSEMQDNVKDKEQKNIFWNLLKHF